METGSRQNKCPIPLNLKDFSSISQRLVDRARLSGGERGIRTLDTRLTYTPLAGERLQPLGHLSNFNILSLFP